ncbi:MAG: DUF1592 domain-containing protein [Myxococcota bacterium]
MFNLVAGLALVACHTGSGPGNSDSPSDDNGSTGPNACGAPCSAIPPTVRFARLTHVQWENSVQDLLHLPGPTGLSDDFIGDTLSEGFENDAENLVVSPELWQDYQRSAETLADQLIGDLSLYGVVVPQDPRDGGGGGGGPAYDETVEAESGSTSATTGQSVGSAWNLWSGGELSASFDLPAAGKYRLTARVWADQAGPDLAEATLGIDGNDALTTDVTATSSGSAEEITVEVDATAGSHVVHVGFTNDFYDPDAGEDRNLYVDWLQVESTAGGIGSGSGDDADRDAWIAEFGAKAHRRPLTADELTAYTDLFDQGPELVASGDDFADGVKLVVTAMLQSPWFLYRVEAVDTPSGGPTPLTSYEIASKLSYALWNTMPDDALFTAAAADELQTVDQIRAQAERLLDSPRAHDTIADLTRQSLFLDNYDNLYKDPSRYPEFTATTPASMKAEAQAFVENVVFDGQGSIHELFTSPNTFVNADLAPIYGLPGQYGDDLQPAALDPAERAGLLTLSGFLALEADPYISSPIRRGVFINLHVWCVDLPPPPNNVPPLPPTDGVTTTRELVTAHTGEGTCGEGCHSTLINPPGFAFENYDALGRYRTEEYNQPIDATGTYRLSTGEADWTDAISFSELVGDSVETHRCYSQHLLEYLHGRHVADEDDALLDSFAEQSLTEDRPIRELILDTVLADSFRMRSPEVE